MKDLMHYGVLGMRWGQRKGGRTVNVGRGIGGAVREVGGLLKDAAKDDLMKAKKIGRAVVKAVSYDKSMRPRTSNKNSADHDLAQMLKKKKVNELSNDEIRKLTTRLQLEKQMKDITAADRAKSGRFLKGILSSPFGQKLIASLIKRVISPKTPGDTTPKPPNTYVNFRREG